MFVLELGANEVGPNNTKVWRSDGFYAGYTDKGPIIVKEAKEAYSFPAKDNAQNVLNGDERFKGGRILQIE